MKLERMEVWHLTSLLEGLVAFKRNTDSAGRNKFVLGVYVQKKKKINIFYSIIELCCGLLNKYNLQQCDACSYKTKQRKRAYTQSPDGTILIFTANSKQASWLHFSSRAALATMPSVSLWFKCKSTLAQKKKKGSVTSAEETGNMEMHWKGHRERACAMETDVRG